MTKAQQAPQVEPVKRRLKAVPTPPEPARTKRARTPIDVNTWGRPPVGTIAWGIGKRKGSGWPGQPWADKGESIARTSWPLDLLDAELVRKRWGAGEYRAVWYGDVNGSRKHLGTGRTVFILPKQGETVGPEAPAAEMPEPAPARAPSALSQSDVVANWRECWTLAQEQRNQDVARERETFEQRLRMQQESFAQILALQKMAVGGGTVPSEDPTVRKLSLRVKKLTRIIEEQQEDDEAEDAAQSATAAPLARAEPSEPPTPMARILDMLMPMLPDLMKALPGVLARIGAQPAGTPAPRVEVGE